MYTVTILATLVASVAAISSGKVSLCDATPDVYGCKPGGWPLDDMGQPKRKECKDKSRIMAWATAPVIDEAYFLYMGDDEENPMTSYVPGAHYQVHLRVRQYNRQYRGLLMYAVDANEEKVGDWDFKERSDQFHSFCPKTVLHALGNDKPYLTTWGFTAPPAGTGTIKFRSLIKTGVANTGDFWYANDYELTEATGEVAPAKRWYRATEAGQSCTQVCKAYCKTCVESELEDVNSADKLEELVAPWTTCALPYLARCSAEGPTSSEASGLCFYRDTEFCKAQKMPVEPVTCDSKPSVDQKETSFRLCPCDGVECTPAPTPEPTQATTAAPLVPTPAPGSGAVPKCESQPGAVGCPCQTGSTCSTGLSCKNLVCVVPNPCLYGKKGCPCTLNDKTCDGAGEGLTCDPATNTCVLANREICNERNGELGCWCTEDGGCLSQDLFCDRSKNCARKAAVCEPGNVGCECKEGQCQYGLECKQSGTASVCAVIYEDDTTSASSVSIAVLATLIAALALIA